MRGSLLIWREQGLGDTIMFASILHELRDHIEQLTVALDSRLIPLFERSFSEDIQFIKETQELNPNNIDYHLPIGSLPLYFRSDLADFQAVKSPYLKADASQTKELRDKILGTSSKKLCGVSWSSSRTESVLKNKNIALTSICQAIDTDQIELVNLQYGDTKKEINEVFEKTGINIHQEETIDNFNDLDGLAALISACDFVISIDNVTVEISGALGKKTFVLLTFDHGWRWGIDSEQSYWHPSVQMTRQEERGDWSAPLKRLTEWCQDEY